MAQVGKKQGPARIKHVPQRTCVACRRSDAKRGLIRVVRTPDGRAEVDPTGKRNGRGAYLCHNLACWELALKRRALERALRVETLTDDNRHALLMYVRGAAEAESSALPDDSSDSTAPPHDVTG